ncbi:MAG: hypothetical protein HY331_14665 [Chloroflexi bacterium]|nr:hypothetical protein [Chloroflexota bacterium]
MPLSNPCYDVLTALQNKLQAVTVYDRYIQDCQETGDDRCQQLFTDIKREEEGQVERLRTEVERLVREGKFH